ncbi:MAG TPA: hypothetical protein VHD89_06880 [Rhodanobacteraceae bacterium]|nr:hypothetical protein [Rhodanobacteraceae bacterium]
MAGFLFNQRQQQQFQVAVTEHAATAATSTTAQAVPVGERPEIIVAVASASERAATGITGAGIVRIGVPVERVESMHGVKLVVQFVVHVHGRDSVFEIVFKIYLNNIENQEVLNPRGDGVRGTRQRGAGRSPGFWGGSSDRSC